MSIFVGGLPVNVFAGASVLVMSKLFASPVAVGSSVHSPVELGTASSPEPMATKFEPQFAACARWRFLLSCVVG